MKQIVINKDNSSDEFLYEQLYLNIKEQITTGDMIPGEKCPSLRFLAESLSVSVTTVMQAYNQLTAEGYIKNRPGSGYYVEEVGSSLVKENDSQNALMEDESFISEKSEYIYDEEAFDFNRWKKCAAKIYTEHADSLLYGSDLKGEISLRTQIAKYLFRSRGVSVDPNNIVIAAGTQQTIFHLGRILKKTGVKLIAMETPGYSPVKAMFSDAHFSIADIPVTDSGIAINMLPSNIPSAAYVNPSNQFPTGVVMPAAKRYEILKWAENNDSYIIEDDYNSELRYFGKPLPTIKSLDTSDKVIYLGSFSSTLFSAVKISYMVLPEKLSKIFDESRGEYSQTCSKAEQLTLAYYMSMNYYYTAIRKKRALYTKKLKVLEDAFDKYKYEDIELINTKSGLFVTIRINTTKDGASYVEVARKLGVYTTFIEEISNPTQACISIYYSYIPLGSIELIMNILINKWRTV